MACGVKRVALLETAAAFSPVNAEQSPVVAGGADGVPNWPCHLLYRLFAEMITSTNGLGHLLICAARGFETVDTFVPLITISLLGLLNTGFNALQRRLLLGFPSEPHR